MKSWIVLALTLALLTQVLCDWGHYGNDRISLDSVNALTFYKGKYTAARRTSPIPQLNCIGGSAQGNYQYEPEVVQCKNMGSDGAGNVQWKCEAELDSSVRFGRTDVSCEGYTNSDDPFVLKGSCGLEYTLEYTEQGKQRQAHSGYSRPYYNTNSDYHYSTGSMGFGTLIMWAVIIFISYQIYKQCMYNMGYNNGAPSDGTYGPGTAHGTAPGYGGYPKPYTSYPTYSAPQPGFWSGFGTGGLLGYLFSRPSYYSGYNNYGYRPSFGGGWSSSGSGFGGSFGGGSSTRTSSGFGTTKRR